MTTPVAVTGIEVVVDLTRDEAEALTERIKVQAENLWVDITEAYQRRAWAVLGYETWDAYTTSEFGSLRLRLPREERQEIVCSLRESGMPIRAIASATGADPKTVQADLKSPVGNSHTSPTTVTGTDGKKHPAKKPTPSGVGNSHSTPSEEPVPSEGQPIVDPDTRMRPKKPNPLTCDVDTWDDSYTRISHGIEALLRNPTHAQAARIEKLLRKALSKVDTIKGTIEGTSEPTAVTLDQVADGEVVVAYSSLPGTAKQKVDSIARWIVRDCEADLEDIRQDIEIEHAERIGGDVQSFLDERIKNLETREAKAEAIIQAHRGKAPLTDAEYQLISNLLHQDTRLSASDEKLHRARLLFNTDQMKALLVAADDDHKTPTPRKKPLPSYLPPSARRVKEAQERKKRQEARAARRARFYNS